MPKEKIKIEFQEKDLLEVFSNQCNLKLETIKVQIYHYEGDAREQSYTTITVEGERE